MKKTTLITFLILFFGSGLLLAEEMTEVSGLNAVSYSAGFRLGDTFIKQRVPLVPEMVMRGLEDARNSVKPLMPKGEMRMILSDPKKYLIEDMNNRSDLAKKSGRTFLEANAQEEGVMVLESGLQYKILAEGDGNKPKREDSVQLDYQAATLNGQVFDSTANAGNPAIMLVQSVIPGLAEGLQKMSEGGEWEFYIPTELAYNNSGPLADQTLVYKVKLLKVIPLQ